MAFFSPSLRYFVFALLFLAVSCAGTAYRRAVEVDDPREYRVFLERYPQSPYADNASAALERWSAFEATRREKTPEAYRRFLKEYPGGKTAIKARRTARALELLKKAELAGNSGNEDEVRKLLGAAVAADPENRDILIKAGNAALEEGLAGEAAAWLGEAVRLDPGDYLTRALLVRALLKAGKTADGVEEARKVLGARSEDIRVYKLLSAAFLESGIYDIAALVLDEQIKVFGPDPAIVQLAANAYLAAGAPIGCLKVLDKIPDAGSNPPVLIKLRGECYLELGDHERAHECFQKYITLFPKHAVGYYDDGIALERLGRFNEAIDRYERVLKLDPSSITAIWRLAIVNMVVGNVKEAEKRFGSYIESRPEGPRTEMARRVIAGHLPGFEGISWGAKISALKRLRPNVRKFSSAGTEEIWCEAGAASYAGLAGKRCFVFRSARLIEVRFDAKLGSLNRVKRIDPVIKKLRSTYGNPLSEKPHVNRIVTDNEATTTSEIAWRTPDGLVVLTVKCVNESTGASRCDFRITRTPG